MSRARVPQRRARARARSSARPTPTETSPHRLTSTAVVAAAIVLLTAAIYFPIHAADFVNLDDPVYVGSNAHVLTGLTWANAVWALTSTHDGYWIPATWISYMVDASLFGTSATGFHVTNVALHA